MNESDLDYLRNINTSPGPNAGRRIDPTKPVPDADAAALGQSDAEPVAWLVHSDRGMNFATVDKLSAYLYAERHPNYSVEPLYTAPLPVIQTEFELEDGLHELAFPAPPRPDTSAGLIEASCLLDKRADEYVNANEPIEQGYRMAARFLRVRATGKNPI